MKHITLLALVVAAAPAAFASPLTAIAADQDMQMSQQMMNEQTSGAFKGIEVNGGKVVFFKKDGKSMLRFSPDFMIPNSPAPHWQVVDAQGNVYLLNQLRLVGEKTNRQIVLPKHIKSVAKVQIWCSFAEVNLGEAAFAKPIMVG
jgi:hypothetical protein